MFASLQVKYKDASVLKSRETSRSELQLLFTVSASRANTQLILDILQITLFF